MKLRKIRLQTIRNHVDSTLEFEVFNVVKGGNFQGKTSIAQGISLLFTPSTIGLDATGRGFATKIARGAAKGIITGVIQGSKHTIERTVTLATNTTGRTDSNKCLDDPEYHPAPFERLLTNNRDALSICCNTDRFLTMDEKEQKSLLAKLALPKQHDFPAETIEAVNKVLGDGTVDFTLEPFVVIEKAYKLLYKEREQVNRTVKEFVIPDAHPEVGGMNVTTLQNQLTDARTRQKSMAAERDEAVSKNHEESLQQFKLRSQIHLLNEKIKEESEKVKSVTGLLSDAKLKKLQKIASNKSALDKLEAERQANLTKVAIKKTKVESYTKLVGVSGECPTCHQEIEEETIRELHQKAKEELAYVQRRDTDLQKEIAELGDVDGAERAVTNHDISSRLKKELEAIIAEKTKLLQEATEELSKLPKATTETEVLIPFVKPLDEVDAEITSILAKLQPAMAAEERKKEIATKTAQLKLLTTKAAVIDQLVKYFDKDGIKAKLLAEHIGGFEEKLNFVLDAWGYKISLAIEPDFVFLVTDALGVTTPVKELSGSESLMFLAALQCAVSRAAGIGIVVVDRMDTFLPEERKKANRVLYNLVSNGTLEQIVIIVSDLSEEVPKLPNSAFFMVEAGTVRRL